MKKHYKDIFFALLLIWSASITLAYFKPIKKTIIAPIKEISEKEKLIAHIKKYEALSLTMYKLGSGYYIGYGHKCKINQQKIDSLQADSLLISDFDLKLKIVDDFDFASVNTENKRLALASLLYNISLTDFMDSGLFIDLAGGYPVCRDWFNWHHFNGVDNDKMMQRRIYELNLFLK
jgi:GH24 family phage-related lysozyme (muramidase)